MAFQRKKPTAIGVNTPCPGKGVEIQKADAIRLYGPHAVWKDVGNVCSMTAASNARVVMKRMAVGETGYDDLRCVQKIILLEALTDARLQIVPLSKE
jgi:hypothetical protein